MPETAFTEIAVIEAGKERKTQIKYIFKTDLWIHILVFLVE
jgi:hypothetical protein